MRSIWLSCLHFPPASSSHEAPKKDAGSRTRNSHQLDSGPFRQPGADEGGGAAAPAALVERDPGRPPHRDQRSAARADRKSTRLNSSHLVISYAVFCLKKKKIESCRAQSLYDYASG